MTCDETLRTQAYLDGELDGAGARDAERHIESCAECRPAERGCGAVERRDAHATPRNHRAAAALRATDRRRA